MLGLGRIKFERHYPIDPAECLSRIRQAGNNQTLPRGLDMMVQGNSTVAVAIDGEHLVLRSQKLPGSRATILRAQAMQERDGTVLVGDLRLNTGSRITAAVFLAVLGVFGGGMTLILIYAIFAGTWTAEGAHLKFLLPIIPAGFTAAMLVLLNYISKIDVTTIEQFLDDALGAPR
jgi:hypothetical protein